MSQDNKHIFYTNVYLFLAEDLVLSINKKQKLCGFIYVYFDTRKMAVNGTLYKPTHRQSNEWDSYKLLLHQHMCLFLRCMCNVSLETVLKHTNNN